MRVAILTVSDAGARGLRADTSGDAVASWVVARGDVVSARHVVPDETVEIVRTLLSWCDGDVADVIFTTGGTGLSPRDVTPEATRAVLERTAPGLAERMRGVEWTRFPRAALSRGTAGVRARSLVINLPGSTSGVRDGLAALTDILSHAVAIIRDAATDHSPGARPSE